MTTELYKPPGSIPLNSLDYNFQKRIGLQGFPKTGKTTAAATFPNPIFISLDRGLTSLVGRSDIIEMPFYDGKFVDTIVKRDGIQCPPNVKDSLITWLTKEAPKLNSNQTLVLDGSTGIEAAYHSWYRENKVFSKSGEEDKFAQWRMKIDFFSEITILIKTLKCNVIYLCHEVEDTDDKGNINGEVRPLLTGQFSHQLGSHFTDWFRCHAVGKPTDEKRDEFKKKYSINDSTLKEWMESTPKEHHAIYIWQTQSDSKAKCGTSLMNCPKYILAHYNSITKYTPKQNAS
jgi:hypothetical protein